MSFWDLPNFEKTAEATDKFLSTQCERLALRAGVRLTDLSSPQLSLAPAHSNAVNHQEENLQRGLQAIEALEAIRYTMDKTHGVSPEILIRCYLKREPVWKIRQGLLIDHSSFPELKKVALNQFADCWEKTQEVYKWAEEDRIHLQIFFPEKEQN